MNNKKQVWCNLNNSPCIHPSPDDLENCRYCEKYSFSKYMKFKYNKQKGE